MAAIFGIVTTSPSIDLHALLPRMQSRLAYRAPDGFTHWAQDGCMLVHGALHVGAIPAQATQPLRLADGCICVADGYVANFDDVRDTLGIEPCTALDDAQLLALAIEHWGETFTDHVHGEFALALWNPRLRSLRLYRDHLGARPVYYVQTPQLFAFASSAWALLGLPGVEARLDPLGIVTLWYDDASYLKLDYSAFEGVPALPPGHRLSWREGVPVMTARYWRVQPLQPVHRHDEREYVEAFREVFGSAVARSMRGSTATALMLSGGIDSAAILAARRGFRKDGVADDLLCTSAVLGQGDHPQSMTAENHNILAMTRRHPRALQFSVPVTAELGSPVTPADLAEVAWTWIHPMDMSLLVPSLTCGLAKRAGCRLMLNGVDGDNVASSGSSSYLKDLVLDGQLRRAWIESAQAARVHTQLQGQAPIKLFARALITAFTPDAIRRVRHRHRVDKSIRDINAHPEMAPKLSRLTNLAQRLSRANELRLEDSLQRRCDHLAYWLAVSLDGSNRIVSRYGMDVRHPWCDLQVLKFFQQLPVGYRSRHGWNKWVVRRSCEEALGSDVVWHSGKSHLGSLLNRQVLEDASPYLRLLLEEERPRLQEYVRDEVITDAIDRMTRRDLGDPAVCDRVFVITGLAGWLRHVHEQLDKGVIHA